MPVDPNCPAMIDPGAPRTCPPLAPEDLWNDPTLSDAEKARVYDALFEYHGDGEGDDADW